MKVAVIPHEDKVFEDQVVYVGGHMYTRCTFRRCTMVLTSGASALRECAYEGCVWHINLLIHDPDQWDDFMATTASLITRTLPAKE